MFGTGDDPAALLDESLRLFRDLRNYACTGHTLLTAATYHAGRGELERAAQLVGAVQGIRDRLAMVIAPYEDRTPFVEQLGLADMDSELRQEAFEAGRAMAFDEAVDFALQGLKTQG
jgi:hypothetical protein